MKKRIIAFLLCIALVMPILPTFASATEDITLSATSVTLPQYEKKTITASPVGNVQVSSYQWQINVPGTDLWVDISGAEGATLELSYAMIASLLQGDQAQIRCEVVIGGETVETDVVTVTMDYTSEPAVQTESEPAKPQVLTEATVVESSVSAPAEEEEEIESETVDLAALEEARNAAIVAETDAETAVTAAQEKLTAAQTAEEAAKAALDQAQADYDAAVAAAATAETEEPNPTGESTEGEDSNGEITESTPVVTVDTTALDAAKAAYAAAQAVTAAAQKELDEANAALTAAQAKTAAAREAYEAAEAKAAAPARSAFNVIRRTSNAVMMANENVDTAADVNRTHIITIQYFIKDTSKEVADPYLAEAMEGKPFNETVASPTVVGYTPQEPTYEINIDNVSGPVTYTVYYEPSNVGFTVEHYQQNLDMASYTLAETERKDGNTGSPVGDVHKTYEGFTYLLYERPTVAADGKTVVEVKYDRKYILVNFDLGGGYGVEPIYAPYGSSIDNVGTPVKAGYAFGGWSLDGSTAVSLPATVPANNLTYHAIWNANDSAKVTVVFWGENADDEEYSYISSSTITAKPGEKLSYDDILIKCGNEAHQHGDDCYACHQEEHTHTSACYSCGYEEHTHGPLCYSTTGGDLSTTAESSDNWLRQLNNADPNDKGVYSVARYNSNRYYVKIGGSFYQINNYRYNRFTITLNCDKSEHTHGTNCNVSCGKNVHMHSTACGYDCGKTVHIHSSACYAEEVMDSDLWTYVKSDEVTVAANGSSVINVCFDRTTFTLNFYDGYNKVYAINEKWGANISAHWPIKGTNGTTYDSGERWRPSGSNTYTKVLVYLDIMPAESFDLSISEVNYDTFIMHYMVEVLAGESGTTYNGKTFKESFEVTANYNYVTKEEDFFDLDGFTQWTSNPTFKSNDQLDIDGGGDVYFYYTRNSYRLDFHDGYDVTKSESVKYEAPLSTYASYVPKVPSAYEVGSVVFDGWYLNPECTGEEYDLTKNTMPASNLILYAKWAPVTHKVKIFLREEDTGNPTNQLGETQIVDHRATAEEPDKNQVVNPESEDYEFVGWFYKEGNEEKAFDFSMGVTKDLVLYAKWSSNVEKEFTIYYKLDGTNIDVADPTTGKGLVDNSKTFDAKVGEELYKTYQEGFFPDILSHTITLNITDENNSGANTYTFWYKETTVPYTVKYVDKNGAPVAPEKVVKDNKKSYVTETFVQVPGLLPDAYQKSLALQADTTAEDNVITFIYAEDANRAYYAHTHWFKNDRGEWERRSEDQNIGNIGDKIAAAPLSDLNGYTYDQSLTKVIVDSKESPYTEPVALTTAGLEIRHYYVESKVDLNYVAVGPVGATGFGSVSPEMEEVAIFTGLAEGSTATATDGYEFVGWYDTEECEGEAISTEAEYKPTRPAAGWVDGTTFYAKFQEKEVTIRYEVIGPEGCGTVTPVSETVKVITGTATGSTAAASNNDYKFVGWYSDENCTNQLSTNAAYVPEKIGNKNIEKTYYAKFEYNLTTMTITKSLSNGACDPQDTFIFDVSGSDGSSFVVTLTPAGGRDSVTIANVTVGVTYTVTERAGGGSNRYTAAATSAAKALSVNGEENVFAFTNTLSNNKWLTATDVKHNVFG